MKTLLLTLLLLQTAIPQQAEGVVSGVILSADGKPATNVRVALSTGGDVETLVSITRTDSMGRYRFEKVPSGRYYLVAGLLAARPTYFPGVTSRATATILTITGSSLVEAPAFQLVEGSGPLVRGRVNGVILPGQTMTSLEFDLTGADSATRRTKVNVAPDGSFEVSGLAVGIYEVYLMGRVVSTFLFVNNDITNLVIAPKPSGAEYRRVKGRINGTVPAGQLSTSLEFDRLGGNSATRRSKVNLAPDGSFEVLDLTPGTYEVYLFGRVVSIFQFAGGDISGLVFVPR